MLVPFPPARGGELIRIGISNCVDFVAPTVIFRGTPVVAKGEPCSVSARSFHDGERSEIIASGELCGGFSLIRRTTDRMLSFTMSTWPAIDDSFIDMLTRCRLAPGIRRSRWRILVAHDNIESIWTL